jgi:imidazoleglycerol phosphate synthase glutamine amidotransferase subunit HisH
MNNHMSNDFKDLIANTFERWGVLQRPKLTREEVGKMMGISIGLGSLFNESVEAERDWMQTPHRAFKTRPITMVLAGRWDEVLAQVHHERGLS